MNDDYDIACLRATFEDWTRDKHGWTRFKRDENGYKAYDVQTAWYWLRLGFVTGQRMTENVLEGSDNQTGLWSAEAKETAAKLGFGHWPTLVKLYSVPLYEVSPVPSEERTIELAHRKAYGYLHGSTNPNDNSLAHYVFDQHTLLDFVRTLFEDGSASSVAKTTP